MVTAAAKKTAPRKPADRQRKRSAVSDIPMPEIQVLDLDAEDMQDEEPDLVEIFRVGGKSYFVDRNIGAGVSLRMIKALKNDGEESAVATVLMELLGEDGFDALANCRGIKSRHLAQVLVSCQKAVMGDRETGPKA